MALHTGRCTCGDVRYQVELDLARATRCNCTSCTKLGLTNVIVEPAAFTLLTDEAALPTYSRHPGIGQRAFCPRCHVTCFARFDIPQMGGPRVAVNLNTLDDFDAWMATVAYWDGRHDNWAAGPRPTPWPVRRDGAHA